MINSSTERIKKGRRKSFFLREISKFIQSISVDEPLLMTIYPTRVEFSEGEGAVYVYFSSPQGEEGFLEALEVLKLYKPSIRKSLSKIRKARYTPEIVFKYDDEIEKVRHLEEVLDSIKEEFPKEDEDKDSKEE